MSEPKQSLRVVFPTPELASEPASKVSSNLGQDQRAMERHTNAGRVVQLTTIQEAILVEESYTGLGLVLEQSDGFTIGQEIEIRDRDVVVRGKIAHVTPDCDGRLRLGVELAPYHLPV